MEKVDILDDFENKTGKIMSKEEAHKNKLLHPVIHVWIYNDKRQILLQKRSKNKSFPNLFSASCIGHISANEEIVKAVLRELNEELGIKISKSKLDFIGALRDYVTYNKDVENVLTYIYFLKYNKPIIKLQKNEVKEIKYVSFNKFKKLIINPKKNDFIPHEKGYYELIANKLNSRFI